ncbi:hypothetical protein Cni_G22625 [Canna indica]|uniref:O-fucosyltransferase family protein n=1 Tax=Canna indica TaxID=4628 RepID=A0AAQ3QMU0_9LILI|nr:hypothetical protein Cni_G22625 [Canna indica]
MRRTMAVDVKHIVSGVLTISMFVMLGNMIKRENFDSVEVRLQDASEVQINVLRAEEKSAPLMHWKGSNQELKPCWKKPSYKFLEQPKGYITFSLRSALEYHFSQVADAVVIARYLGATLVLPDIRGSNLGEKRNFEDLYDVDKFIESLNGVVKVVRTLPSNVASRTPAAVRVPNWVSKDFIVENIEPVFLTNHYLRLASYFPSENLKIRENRNKDMDSTACLAMFGGLELKPEILRVANMMVERLKMLSRKIDGRFVAIDLKTDLLESKTCKDSVGKACYNAKEIVNFLKRVGFNGDDTIYITQTWWDESLNVLKEFFPRTYTKDELIPAKKKGGFLGSGTELQQRALDLYVCSKSDVFIPAISGLFYGNVAGKRIASGLIEILEPSEVPATTTADFISTYISKRNHVAYSCYC